MLKRLLFVFAFAISAILPIVSTAAGSNAAADRYSDADFRRITVLTAKILEKSHYSSKKMNAKLSALIFDTYLDSLDPLHMFFTRQDIDKFAIFRGTLGFALVSGEYEFAFTVYDLYRKRYEEYRNFTEKMLASEIDFSINETIPAELSKEPRPADTAAMHELWRKYIKNELLILRIAERAKNNQPENTPAKNNRKSPAERLLQRQRDTGNIIAKRERIDILGLLLDAMARSHGAHSDYQAPKTSEDFEIHMSLSLSGIGATLTSEDGYIKIVELVPGGPAELSGKVKVNDRITSVTQENGDSVDLIDMPVSQAVQYIRGEKGTKVILSILSGTSTVPVNVEIVRDKINLTAGAAKGEIKKVNGVSVGVITLPSFYMDFDAVIRGDADARRASTDVAKILEKFKQESVQSVVVDLRNNGGGSLPDAIILSGLFLSGNPVVQVHGKNELEKEFDPSPAVLYSGPLVVLTSKLSASAAEIFTGAMADAKRAVVVGDSRTFGKGTVLRVESLDRYGSWFKRNMQAGSLTFEIAMFFRPGGSSVQQYGIKPDIQLPSVTEEISAGEIFLDNHLPWDEIEPVSFPLWDKNMDGKIEILRKKSAERIAADQHYQAFIRQIAVYRSLRDKKELSLNEESRYAEYLKEKDISESIDKILSDSADPDKNRDVVLSEAINIAADLSKL